MPFSEIGIQNAMKWRNLAAWREDVKGVPPREIDQRITDALEMIGISSLRHRATTALSGGQKQRVAIAAAIAGMPVCKTENRKDGFTRRRNDATLNQAVIE